MRRIFSAFMVVLVLSNLSNPGFYVHAKDSESAFSEKQKNLQFLEKVRLLQEDVVPAISDGLLSAGLAGMFAMMSHVFSGSPAESSSSVSTRSLDAPKVVVFLLISALCLRVGGDLSSTTTNLYFDSSFGVKLPERILLNENLKNELLAQLITEARTTLINSGINEGTTFSLVVDSFEISGSVTEQEKSKKVAQLLIDTIKVSKKILRSPQKDLSSVDREISLLLAGDDTPMNHKMLKNLMVLVLGGKLVIVNLLKNPHEYYERDLKRELQKSR